MRAALLASQGAPHPGHRTASRPFGISTEFQETLPEASGDTIFKRKDQFYHDGVLPGEAIVSTCRKRLH